MTASHPPLACLSAHPLVSHNLSLIRDKNSSGEQFRAAIKRLGLFVICEATRNLPTTPKPIETPLEKTVCQVLPSDAPVLIIPILRAGLVLSELALDILPSGKVYHIGAYRDPETLKPVTYYNKLPNTLPYSQSTALVLDPMLATGGSALAVIETLHQRGIPESSIHFACIIAAPEGIHAVHSKFPNVSISTTSIDERLNEKAYIMPGLGDAGDRAFGTL